MCYKIIESPSLAEPKAIIETETSCSGAVPPSRIQLGSVLSAGEKDLFSKWLHWREFSVQFSQATVTDTDAAGKKVKVKCLQDVLKH